jgi:hypothetical protein
VSPCFRVTEAQEFRLEAPLRIAPGRSAVVRTQVSAREGGDARELIVEARVVLTHDGLLLERDRPFCGARVLTVRADVHSGDAPGAPRVERAEPPATPRHGSIFEHSERPVRLGPRFHPIAWIERSGNSGRGAVRAPPSAGRHARTRAPRWLADPLVLDAGFQIAGHWDALRPGGAVAVPVAVRRIVLGAHRPDTSSAIVDAHVVGDDGRDIQFDVRVTTADGAPLAELYGLALRRVGPAVRSIAPALAVARP